MAKYQLDIEPDYNFDLIGIIAHCKDYQLCWSINKLFNISLKKTDEKEFSSYFDLYHYKSEEDHIEYFLFSNKTNNTPVIPELKQIDYFLMLRNNSFIEPQQIIDKLRQLDIIIMTQAIDLSKLKSKEKLIF
jgi:hypothetical protein